VSNSEGGLAPLSIGRVLSAAGMHEWDDLQKRSFSLLPAYFAEDPGEIPKGSGKGVRRARPAKEPVQDFHVDAGRESSHDHRKLQPAVPDWRE